MKHVAVKLHKEKLLKNIFFVVQENICFFIHLHKKRSHIRQITQKIKMKHVAVKLEPVFRDALVTTPRIVMAIQ
jgi:hypothetical protein